MKQIFYILLVTIFIQSCIGDDFVLDGQDAELRILNAPDSIGINTDYLFEAMFLNNIGQTENVDIEWNSLNVNVISINNSGMATALELGTAVIVASYDADTIVYTDSVSVAVGEETIVINEDRTGTINTTSTYALSGDFILSEEGSGVKLEFANNYNASTALPGLYVYLSNNANSVASAYEIGAVQVFSGTHSYTIPDVALSDYDYVVYFCKPFSVKVGDGEIQ
ncbi:MAG: hypothetical protein ACI94Y_002614 [Maribacter sp.]|jgi:hypothetical protein